MELLPSWLSCPSLPLLHPTFFFFFVFVSSFASISPSTSSLPFSLCFHFLLFPLSLPLLPLRCSVRSDLRLVPDCLNHSYSTSHSREWNHHRQLAAVLFAQKARGNGEKCVGCAWCDETAGVSECPSHQMPTCSLNFFPTFWLLSLDLHHHCWSFVWLQKGNEVFSWSETFGPLSLGAWKTSEQPSKCIFVWDNANLTHKQSSFTNCKQCIKTLCPAFPTFLHPNLWMLGLNRLVLRPPATTQSHRCLGVNVGHGHTQRRSTKACRGGWTTGGLEDSYCLKTPTTCVWTPSHTPACISIQIRSNVCLLGRQSGQLSALLFLHPSFISH